MIESTAHEVLQKTLLVVDRERAVRELVRRTFEPRGYRVLEAEDVNVAHAILCGENVGVVLTGEELGGGRTGADVIAALQGPTQAILMGTLADTNSAVDGRRSDTIDYLRKPFENEQLVATVERAFRTLELDIEQDALMCRGTLVESIPGLMWFTTENGIFKRISDSGAAALGYRPEDLVGRSYETVFPETAQDPAVHWAFKERRTGPRSTRRVVGELETAEGMRRIFEIYSCGVYVASNVTGYQSRRLWGTVGVAHDITEQFLVQDAMERAERMEALGRLAVRVAHDLNNALAVILNGAEYVKECIEDQSEAFDELMLVEEAANRAANLSRKLLAFSRKDVIEPQLVNIGEVIDANASQLEQSAGPLIEVVPSHEDELWQVEIDPRRFTDSIFHLVSNAKKAMPEKGTLSVHAANMTIDATYACEQPEVEAGEYVMLAVSDTGSGMPREQREHLFEPFYTSQAMGDSELGLAAVFGFVKQSGGFISVFSEAAIGTSIKAFFPRAARPVLPVEPPVGAHGNQTVLLVEDDVIERRIARRVLKTAGYHVIDANNGDDALTAFADAKPPVTVLVTDVVLPKMDGSTLATKLREEHPGLRVVYISGYVGSTVLRLKLLGKGARFLQKPFAGRGLLAAIQAVLGDQL